MVDDHTRPGPMKRAGARGSDPLGCSGHKRCRVG
jgi:hypothetical protein